MKLFQQPVNIQFSSNERRFSGRRYIQYKKWKSPKDYGFNKAKVSWECRWFRSAVIWPAKYRAFSLKVFQHSVFPFSACLPSTSKDIPLSEDISWDIAVTVGLLTVLCSRGLRNSFVILAMLTNSDWHWHWHSSRRRQIIAVLSCIPPTLSIHKKCGRTGMEFFPPSFTKLC